MSVAPSGKEATRLHIVQVAGDLFYRKGVRAVGVDEVVAAAEIAKATLYTHFRSKAELIVATLEFRRQRLQASFEDALAIDCVQPQARIASVFEALGRTIRSPAFRGCAFMRAVAEHSELASVAEVVRAYKCFIRDAFLRILDGHVDDSEICAERLALIYEGAIAVAVVRPEIDPSKIAADTAAIVLAAAARH